MELLAAGAGVIVGLIVLLRYIDFFLIILYCALFTSRPKFEALYDVADDEVTYRRFAAENKAFSSYAEYLSIHAAARPSAFKRFRNYYDNLTKLLATRMLPLLLLPTLLFWPQWHLYVAGVFAALITLAAYKTFIKGYRVGFYQRLVIFTVINDYQKQRTR